MKIVKGKQDRDVEEIIVWDGPLANKLMKIEKGRPYFYVPMMGERRSLSTDLIYFTIQAYDKYNLSDFVRITYERSDELDEEGRVFFKMPRL